MAVSMAAGPWPPGRSLRQPSGPGHRVAARGPREPQGLRPSLVFAPCRRCHSRQEATSLSHQLWASVPEVLLRRYHRPCSHASGTLRFCERSSQGAASLLLPEAESLCRQMRSRQLAALIRPSSLQGGTSSVPPAGLLGARTCRDFEARCQTEDFMKSRKNSLSHRNRRDVLLPPSCLGDVSRRPVQVAEPGQWHWKAGRGLLSSLPLLSRAGSVSEPPRLPGPVPDAKWLVGDPRAGNLQSRATRPRAARCLLPAQSDRPPCAVPLPADVEDPLAGLLSDDEGGVAKKPSGTESKTASEKNPVPVRDQGREGWACDLSRGRCRRLPELSGAKPETPPGRNHRSEILDHKVLRL